MAAICDLRQEVNSGGFDVYFRYWGANTAELAVRAIERVLGAGWAAVLSEAMALFGPAFPLTVDERESILTEAVSEALDALDERYLDLEASTEADALLGAELTRHQ